jgi:hypothetical protein
VRLTLTSCRPFRNSLLLLILTALISLSVANASLVSAQTCRAKYVLEDHSSLAIVAFSYVRTNGWSSQNLLAAVLSPGSQQLIVMEGAGPATFQAILVGNRRVAEQVKDLCAQSQIIVFERKGKYEMIVR